MNHDTESLIQPIKSAIEKMLSGTNCAQIEYVQGNGTDITAVNDLIETTNILIRQLNEVVQFSAKMCQGELDIPTPDKTNRLAGSLKELHSQLLSLAWNMEQLSTGRIVNKLYYPGKLFIAFNELLGLVSYCLGSSTQDPNGFPERVSTNSWRYHQLLSALNTLKIMVIEVTLDGTVLYTNKQSKEYFGNVKQFQPIANGTEERKLVKYISNFPIHKKTTNVIQELYDEKDDAWYKITSEPIVMFDGTKGYLHVVDDISLWKVAESHLKQTAITDTLTRAFNRTAGMKALEEALYLSSKQLSCAAFFDLDNLKRINDEFGHVEGDWAIESIANILLDSVRENDIVSRYGGDEFMVVFKNCKKESAENIVKRMYKKLDEVNKNSGRPFTVNFSYGLIEIAPDDNLNVSDLLIQMDRLMYEDKKQRKLKL